MGILGRKEEEIEEKRKVRKRRIGKEEKIDGKGMVDQKKRRV